MVTELHKFLTEEECAHLIKLIDANNYRSTVAGGPEQQSVVSQSRTSSTSNLPKEDSVVQKIKKRIAAYIGVDIELGEDIQGQLYQPGQYFKAHTDYFTGADYTNHCLFSGNRTHTFMIYLNGNVEGGETDFPNLNLKIKPELGKGVFWENMIDGEIQPNTLHEGTEVISGSKYIITSWWRENKWDHSEDVKLAEQSKAQVKNSTQEIKTFTTKEDLPKLTESGYKVVKCPEDTWNIIQDAYKLLQNNIVEESWDGIDSIINSGERRTEMMSFDNLVSIRTIIHNQLKPIHEEFCGEFLEPTSLYGIRSYNKGATLINHTDRIETHHISSIIIVDKDLNCGCSTTKGRENDWALDFQDHNGEWHKIYAEIGDIILYESATCMHGRTDEFKGNWYRNFYVHYKLRDWKYIQ